MIGESPRFAEAVGLGLAAAENGDFVDSGEVWACIERVLKRDAEPPDPSSLPRSEPP